MGNLFPRLTWTRNGLPEPGTPRKSGRLGTWSRSHWVLCSPHLPLHQILCGPLPPAQGFICPQLTSPLGLGPPLSPPQTYTQGFMWFLLTLPLYVPPPSLCQALIIALPILPTLLMRRPIFHSSRIHCSILMWNVYISISLHRRKMASFLQPIDFCPLILQTVEKDSGKSAAGLSTTIL